MRNRKRLKFLEEGEEFRIFEQGNYCISVWKVFRIFRREREDLEFSSKEIIISVLEDV